MKLSIVAGATSQSINIFIQDSSSTTGAGLSGLVFNTSGLTAYYSFTGANAGSVQITLATLSLVTSAYSSGGFKEIDATNMKGWYRFDLPNAALAASKGRCVSIHLQGAANMAPLPLEIELTGWDNQDAVHGGMSALPNTAVTTNASLLTSGTGTDQLSVTSGRIDIGKALGTAVTLDANNVLNVSAKYLGGTLLTARDIGASVLLSAGTGTGQLDFTSGVVKANVTQFGGAAGHFTVSGYPDVNTAYFSASAVSLDATSTYPLVALTALDSAVLASGTAQAGGTNTITLASLSSSTDSIYVGCTIKIYSGTGANQVRRITGYVGSTKVATVDWNWTTQPTSSSVYAILAQEGPKLDSNLAVTAGTVSDKTAYSLTQTFPANFSSLSIDASGRVDLGKILGTASAGAAGYVGLDWGHINAPTTTQNLSGTTIANVTVGGFASGLTGAVSGFLKVDVEAWADTTGAIGISSSTHPVVTVNDGTCNLDPPDTPTIANGTLSSQAGAAANQIVIQAALGTANNQINGALLDIYSGTGIGQSGTVTAYDNTAKKITIDHNWITQPVSGDKWALRFANGAKIDSNQCVTVGGFTAGAITTAAYTAGAINSTVAPNLDAAVSAVKAQTDKLLFDGSNFVKSDPQTNVTIAGYASGQDPATLVLGATASSWNTAGTIGHDINAAGTAGDPWTTALPGSYGAGTAGNIVGTNLNATVGSRSTYAGGDTSGTTTLLTRIPSAFTFTSGNVNSAPQTNVTVGGYAASQDPGTYVLSTPANKLLTDASGRVTTTYAVHKNTALNNFEFVMFDSTDHVTPKTGLTVTGQVSLDGGAFTNLTNAPVEVANGVYKVNLAAADTNATVLTLRFTATGADATLVTIPTQS